MTKLSDVFAYGKLALLNVFLKEEALSYRKYQKTANTLNQNGKEWLRQIKQVIANEIEKKCPNGFNWATFVSLGNAGSIEHKLEIYGNGDSKWFNWKEPSIEITLCTCGNINCWGSLQIISKE